MPEAARLLDAAVARDPNFLLAWCQLANVHDLMYFQGHDRTPPGASRTGKQSSPGGSAHSTQFRGSTFGACLSLLRRFSRFYSRAREELAIARRTLPNNAELFFRTGVFDYRQGLWDEATGNLERAIELDPRNLQYVTQMALCYQPQRRYLDETRMWERALGIVPGDANTRVCKAEVLANWKADMKPYQTTLAALVAENPKVASDVDDPLFALRERTVDAAERVLRNYPADGIQYYSVAYPRACWEGVVRRWQGDNAKARAAFTSARNEVDKVLQEQPEFPAALSLLGMIDAGLGRKEEAIREGKRACELLPMPKDAVDGVAFVVNLAQIFAWTSEKDLAIEQLNAALKVPNDLHYGEMRLHPLWDLLRDDPRFETLMEEAKKPFGLKENKSAFP